MAWHACKRVFASALMIAGGMTEAGLRGYLLDAPWFCDHARAAFRGVPAGFVAPMIAEMLRSGAGTWREGRLLSWLPAPVRDIRAFRVEQWSDFTRLVKS